MKAQAPIQAKIPRILIAKPGLDGHDRGAKVIARTLKDAGWEVIYTGLRQTPSQIVHMAIQEDVDLIGLSILSGGYETLCKKVIQLLREKGMDIPVVLGGVIPQEAHEKLKQAGVAAVFGQEHNLDVIVDSLRELIKDLRIRRKAL